MSFPELEEAQRKKPKQMPTATYQELEQAKATAIAQKEAKYQTRKRAAPTQYTAFVQRASVYARQEARSAKFYRGLGFPEFAGKYEPFEIPEGYKVQEITKTPEGLDVTFKPPEEPKGIAETLLSFKWVPISHYLGLTPPPTSPRLMKAHITGEPLTTRPFAGFAGLIAPFESITYSVGRLAGLPTPRPPPTFTGGLIWSGVQSVLAGKPVASAELTETMDYPSEYAVGSVIGDVFLGYLLGKGVSKLAQPITKPITAKAQTWLSKQYLEKGPLAWKGLSEKFVMKVTGARPYLAPEIVSIPSPHTTLSAFRAMQAWEFTLYPRVSGLQIGGVTGASKRLQQWVADAWIKRITGGLSYALVQEELLAGKPALPYIPKMYPVLTRASPFLWISGVAGTITLKVIPKPKQAITVEPREIIVPKQSLIIKPKVARKTKPFLFTFPSVAPTVKTRKQMFPWVSTKPMQYVEQPQMLKVAQRQRIVQAQKQLQRQVVAIRQLTVPKTVTLSGFPFEERKRRVYKRKGKRTQIGIGRYKRFYPAKTPKELMEILV